MEAFFSGFGIVLAEILLWVAVLATIGFAVWQIIQDPKKGLTVLIGVGVVAVIFGIAYGMASGDTTSVAKYNVSSGTYRFVGACLGTMWTLLALAVVAIIVSEVRSFLK